MEQSPLRTRRARRAAVAPRRRLLGELTILAIVGVLLVAAVAAGAATAYRALYSPSAFVERYLDLLSAGRAADALALPGVSIDSSDLEAAGLPATSSDALLRRAALGPLTDATAISETTSDEVTTVVATYRAGGYAGTTTFQVERAGSVGVLPTWRFVTSPLAVVDLTLAGSSSFTVNGFAVDRAQVVTDTDVDPRDPIPLLVLSPGLYSVAVDTPIATTPGVAVLSDVPLAATPVWVTAQPTAEFAALVQQRVEEYLTACATQDVLMPTGCPFGYVVENRIVSPPDWTIVQQPEIALAPDGDGWSIVPTDAVAHIVVEIRSIFDGSVRDVDEDVPFRMGGVIEVQPDGSASISVTAVDAG